MNPTPNLTSGLSPSRRGEISLPRSSVERGPESEIVTLPQRLGDGLTLRAVSSPADIQGYIDLSAKVTNEGEIVRRLLNHHPTTTHADYWLVCDEATGAVVSTTCLLPWRCQLEGLGLKVAMLEMVVTDPRYRQRGLVRRQIEHFHRVVAARGFDLCIIQGIPYYYRQYGYGYAIDHTPLTGLTAGRIPLPSPGAPLPYHWRPAILADIDDLVQLYGQAMGAHQLTVERSAADWRYLLAYKEHPVQLISDVATGQVMGYFVASTQQNTVRLYEHAIPTYGAGLAVLQGLAATGVGEVQIAGPGSDWLVTLARTLGGVPLPVTDQWLWRVPDWATLLIRLAPRLEGRLAAAGGGDFTGSLRLNLYRQAYALHFHRGKLMVETVGFVDASMGADGGDLCIPPEAFIRLLLGYRTLEQLCDSWPDILIKPAMRYWVEALFPPLVAHVLMPY